MHQDGHPAKIAHVEARTPEQYHFTRGHVPSFRKMERRTQKWTHIYIYIYILFIDTVLNGLPGSN